MSNITINPDLCKGCGQCVKDCAVAVLTIENGKCVIKEDKKKNCMQCGHCAAICKSGAIQLFGLENEKLPENPQTVEEIMKCRRSIRQWKGAVPNEEIKKLLTSSFPKSKLTLPHSLYLLRILSYSYKGVPSKLCNPKSSFTK